MKTMVDVVLDYDSVPANAKHTAYRVAYFQIMKDMTHMAQNGFPPIVDLLPEGASWADKENRAMARALYGKRKGEHYSTFMKRVFALARTARSMRGDLQ